MKWIVVLAVSAGVSVQLWHMHSQLVQLMRGASEQRHWVDVLRYAGSERAMAAVMAGLAPTPHERAVERARFEAAQDLADAQLRKLKNRADPDTAEQLLRVVTRDREFAQDLAFRVADATEPMGSQLRDSATDPGPTAGRTPDSLLMARWHEATTQLAAATEEQAALAQSALLQALQCSFGLVAAACAIAAITTVASVRSGRRLAVYLQTQAAAAVKREAKKRRRIEDEQLLQDKIIRALRDGVLIVDASRPGLPITYANEAICEMTGYTRGEFIERSSDMLYGPDSAAESVAQLDKAIAERKMQTVALKCYRKDATPFWNLVTLVPIADAAGVVTRFVSFQRDITELKQQQREQVTAQRLAALGELAGGIAHDFNNLLSAITGMCDLLHERVAGQPTLEHPLNIIRQAALRGSNQVRRLMNLTRAPMLSPTAVDLRSLGGELEQLLSRSLPENIDLSIVCDADAAWVASEPAQLESVLLNLVLNARHALPEGGWIRIRSHRLMQDGRSWVRLCVKDNGVGMDEVTQARVFDPFFTTREPGSGSGLGLAMVHAYVSNLGGRISVRSELGRGTSFELLLPPAAKPETEAAAPPAEASRLLVSPADGATALLVDDDDIVRVTSHLMLERLGYTVIDCADSAQAEAVLKSKQRLDLMLTDFLLPGGMNGQALGQCARLNRPGLAVVLMSGWTDETLPADDQAAFDAFLAKPFTLDQLHRAVEGVVVIRRPETAELS